MDSSKSAVSHSFDQLPERLRERFRSLADELIGQLDEIAAAVVQQIQRELPRYSVEDPVLAELVRAGATPSIRAELLALQDDARLPEECPAIDAEGARIAARNDVPLDRAVWAYRAGHEGQWMAWYRLVDERVDDDSDRRALHEAGSAFFFAYVDRLASWFTEEYTAERDRVLLGRERRQLDLVRALLAEREVDAGALGYRLAAHHLGTVSWEGPGAADAVRGAATELDRRALVVGVGERTWWSWLGGDRPWSREEIGRLASLLGDANGGRHAVGTPQHGVEGFRTTHREAERVHALALSSERAISRFDELELELLCLTDPEAAARFVARQLHGIDGSSSRSRRLRETLAAYLERGGNAAATAADLGVHTQTIANRLRAIEERTGRPLLGCYSELDVALRLRRRRA